MNESFTLEADKMPCLFLLQEEVINTEMAAIVVIVVVIVMLGTEHPCSLCRSPPYLSGRRGSPLPPFLSICGRTPGRRDSRRRLRQVGREQRR